MFKTYANFQKLSELYEGSEDLTQITLNYQKTQDPVLLAVVFCKWFPMVVEVSKRFMFYGITLADVESHATMELHRAMMAFDPNQGNQIQTLYITYYRNRLKNEVRKMRYVKRRANAQNVLIGEVLYAEGMQAIDYFDEVEFLRTLEQSPLLTKNELKYCEIVIRYKDKMLDSDIACRLGISPSAVFQIKQSLIKKLRRLDLISC